MKKFLCSILALLMILGTLCIIPVSAAETQVPTVLGASMRLAEGAFGGEQGLRFVAKVAKSGGATLTAGGKSVNFGIILVPKTGLSSGAAITVSTTSVKKVPAENLMSRGRVEACGLDYDDGYYYFNAVVTGIPYEYYETKFVVRAYVDNSGSYTYSVGNTERSVKDIADAISADSGASTVAKSFASTAITACGATSGDVVIDAAGFTQLVTYPEYPSYIPRDYLYSVSVQQNTTTENLVVYNRAGEYFSGTRSQGNVDADRRFCEFAFDWAPVTVKIQVNTDMTSYRLTSTSGTLTASYSNGVISVTMQEPEYFTVLINEDVTTALAVFADYPEVIVPQSGDANVIYVSGDNQIAGDSGLYTLSGNNNEIMTITKNGAKLYIAPGAVLTKRVVVSNTNGTYNDGYDGYNVKIYGRGAILDPYSNIYSYNETTKPTTVNYDNGTVTIHATVQCYGYSDKVYGIKILDSRDFNLKFGQSNGIAENVKVLSSEISTDGITTGGASGVDCGYIKNCFVYCGDNGLVAGNSSSSNGYHFENILVGTTCAAIYPQFYCQSTFKNITVFRCDDGVINVFESGVGSQNVSIDGLYVTAMKTSWLVSYRSKTGSDTKTLTLKNVVMPYNTGSQSNFTPASSTSGQTLFYNQDGGSGMVVNATNLYVGGNKIDGATNKVKVANSSTTATTGAATYTGNGFSLTFASDNSSTPKATTGLQGISSTSASYTYAKQVFIGSREVFLKTAPVNQGGTWYLPYDEIVSYLAVTPGSSTKTAIDGVQMISLANLQSSGAVTAASYGSNQISLTAKYTASSTNLLPADNQSVGSKLIGYEAYKVGVYYGSSKINAHKTTSDDTSTWGLTLDITDIVKEYGSGNYTLGFDLTGTGILVQTATNGSTNAGTSASTGTGKSVTLSSLSTSNTSTVIVFKCNSSSATDFALANITLKKAS